MLASPDSHSPQCMMEGNDVRVNTPISPCSSSSGLTTRPNFRPARSLATSRPTLMERCTRGKCSLLQDLYDFASSSRLRNGYLAAVRTAREKKRLATTLQRYSGKDTHVEPRRHVQFGRRETGRERKETRKERKSVIGVTSRRCSIPL